MRIVILAVCSVVSLGLAGMASGAGQIPPRLTIGAAERLSVTGTGFAPRTFVTLRVAALARLRVMRVQTGPRGRFTLRFDGFDRCDPLLVSAKTATGLTVRVPIVWFTRTCMDGPPVQPGVPPPIG